MLVPATTTVTNTLSFDFVSQDTSVCIIFSETRAAIASTGKQIQCKPGGSILLYFPQFSTTPASISLTHTMQQKGKQKGIELLRLNKNAL